MQLDIQTPVGPGLAEIERPSGRPRGLLVLGHGAGGGVDAPDLRAARAAALRIGVAVARVTQPYRVDGRRSPAPAPTLDTAWTASIAAIRTQRGMRTLPLVCGGRSSGARVACRTADALGTVGVVCLAFPVHPPGRPEKSRLEELEQPTVPVLVVQGDRDAFGMPPDATGRTIVVIEGADHSLKRDAAGIGDAVAAFLETLLA
jgi:predicted alpha/beta-hydrolase family hydrolase